MKKKIIAFCTLLIVGTIVVFLLFRSGGDRTSFSSGLGMFTQNTFNTDPIGSNTDIASAFDDNIDTSGEEFTEVIEATGFTKEQFLGAYEKAMAVHDGHLKLNIATTVYEMYGDETVIPLIVLIAMQQKNLSKAGEYLELLDIYDITNIQRIGVYPIINILLNQELSSSHLDMIKAYVDWLSEKDLIEQDDKYFYYSLIALGRGDTVHFRYFSDYLVESSQYSDWYMRLQSIKKQVEQYEFVPDYFYNGLIGVELFFEGWYTLAIAQGKIITSLDSAYQLGYQLQGNGMLFMNRWSEASQIFEQLKLLENKEMYTFLQGISAYNGGRYNESILLLKQLRNTPYQLDVKRYLLLSYASLNDWSGVSDTMKSLIGYELTPYDYFTMFDILFFDYLNTIDGNTFYKGAESEVSGLILRQCRRDLVDHYGFVCLYGQSGLLYYNGEYDKALPLMQGLTQWYPTSRIYERIGHIAWEKGDLDLGKESFIKAFAASEDISHSEYLRSRITDIVKNQ